MVNHRYSFRGGLNTNNLVIKERDISADIYLWSTIYSTKKAVEDSVMLRYHLWSMRMKANKPPTIFFNNMIVILNSNNSGRSFNNKIVAFS